MPSLRTVAPLCMSHGVELLSVFGVTLYRGRRIVVYGWRIEIFRSGCEVGQILQV